MRARILIVEDHPLVAQGLRALIAGHYEVVGVVGDSRDAVSTVQRLRPDLVLLDLSMPDIDGLHLLPQLLEKVPGLKVLVVTMHVDRNLAQLSLRHGARGFIPKESTPDELREAIARVLDGAEYLSPRVGSRGYHGADVIDTPELDRLTPRQREILVRLAEGRTSADIAEELGVTVRTIEFHRLGMRRALGIANEPALIRYAVMVVGSRATGGGAA